MRSSLSVVAALAMLLPATIAVAQQPAPADTSTPPATATPATPPADTMTPAAPAMAPTAAAPMAPAAPAPMVAAPKMTAPAATTDAAAGGVFYTAMSDEWLATSYIGKEVYGPNNERLGKITDLVMNPSGEAEAAVVGVGGFLGIGRKDIAVSFKSIKMSMKNNSRYLTVNVSKQDLKNAAAYKAVAAKQM